MRGKHRPYNKTTDQAIKNVKQHIESFLVMASHYSRKDLKNIYLESGLSIAKMYSLYKIQCEEINQNPVSSITYRRTFCKDCNYSFFKPKKDQCTLCNKYGVENDVDKAETNIEYVAHLQRKKDSLVERDLDKERASKEHS